MIDYGIRATGTLDNDMGWFAFLSGTHHALRAGLAGLGLSLGAIDFSLISTGHDVDDEEEIVRRT